MRRPATIFDRKVALSSLAEESFDVVVVGGGVTGAGVALDAAARGLRTALVERADFASGTSSKSSKLVHGGLRYLQQREFGLVHESLVERQRLLHNAPHLVEPLTFLIPLFGKGGVVDQGVVKAYSTALWLYDLAGGWRIGKRHRRISGSELASHFPTLRTDRLVAGFLYYDARTDDARLTLSIIKTAVLEHGATALNHAPVVGFLHDGDGRVTGVRVRPVGEPSSGAWLQGRGGDHGQAETDAGGAVPARELEIRARIVVNATGVWSDELQRLENPRHLPTLRPAKGVHLAVRRDKLPCDLAGVLPVPGDRRSIFVVPWGDHTYLGTTDTDYDGPLEDPRVEPEDVAYVLRAVNAALASPLSPNDVTATWAGLRPLLSSDPGDRRSRSAKTADLSRRHRVDRSPSGVVTITGGKLTTYRKMASDTVDLVAGALGGERVPSSTKKLRLHGAGAASSPELVLDQARAFGITIDHELATGLHHRYGSETGAVLALCGERPELAARLGPGLAHLLAEVVYAARFEMAECVEDVLSRRTRVLLLDAAAAEEAGRRTAELLGLELGWDEHRIETEASQMAAIVEHDLCGAARLAVSRESETAGGGTGQL